MTIDPKSAEYQQMNPLETMPLFERVILSTNKEDDDVHAD